MKALLVSCFLAVVLFASVPTFYVLSTASASGENVLTLQNPKVIYTMPYPGILPDNPLYFLKIIRDRVTEFLTRDPIKKANLYLNYSDKRVVMAEKLAEKGKHQLALSTLSKAEKYSQKIPQLLRDSKKQGTSASGEFLLQLQLSNQKHLEIIQDMLQTFPQGEKQTFQDILRINKDIKDQLQKI